MTGERVGGGGESKRTDVQDSRESTERSLKRRIVRLILGSEGREGCLEGEKRLLEGRGEKSRGGEGFRGGVF